MSSADAFLNTDTPQYQAAQFLSEEDPYAVTNGFFIDPFEPSSSAKIIQRYILSVFYFSTGGDLYWDDCNRGAASCIVNGKESYLSETSECDWVGSTCRKGTIIRLSFISKLTSIGT